MNRSRINLTIEVDEPDRPTDATGWERLLWQLMPLARAKVVGMSAAYRVESARATINDHALQSCAALLREIDEATDGLPIPFDHAASAALAKIPHLLRSIEEAQP